MINETDIMKERFDSIYVTHRWRLTNIILVSYMYQPVHSCCFLYLHTRLFVFPDWAAWFGCWSAWSSLQFGSTLSHFSLQSFKFVLRLAHSTSEAATNPVHSLLVRYCSNNIPVRHYSKNGANDEFNITLHTLRIVYPEGVFVEFFDLPHVQYSARHKRL